MRGISWISIAISASAAVAVATTLNLLVPTLPGWARMILLLVLPAVCATGVIVLEQRRRCVERSVSRILNLILQSDQEVSDATISPVDTRRVERSSWGWAISRARKYVEADSERLLESEQSRASAEVRARRLETEHQRVSEIVTSLHDPVLAVDQYGDVVLANESAEKLLGFDVGNAEHKAMKSLIRSEKLVGLLDETLRHRTAAQRTGEVELADASGETHWYRVTCRAPSDVSGGQPGAVAVLNDISGQKAMQKRNAEFVSAVSHEMKTPLTGIKAYVELLADIDGDEEETRDEFLAVINSQADRLQRLIDNLLNIARIEAGVVQVDKAHQSLNEVLIEAFGIVQPAAEQKEIALERDLSPLYLGILADRDMLLQSAINLLSNAIKYTPENGRVILRSRMRDTSCEFEVEDSGVGLSPEDCKNIFQKFYRVKQQQGMAKGTGLGLALAKHIVEDVHGGVLNVESQLGVGSTFRICLPNMEHRKG